MVARRVFWAAIGAGFMWGCTPGAQSVPTTSSSNVAAAMLVHESLLLYGQTGSQFGTVGGFSPVLVVVAHGTPIQFHNEDSFNHTASGINAASFPGGNPIPFSAQKQTGNDVSQVGWSSGLLTANAFSTLFGTSRVGTYLFGCQIHYPLMRGVIIVQ